MSHRVVIINVVPPTAATAVTSTEKPAYSIEVEYIPTDDKTAQQIGNEVERIMRKCEQIVAGTG